MFDWPSVRKMACHKDRRRDIHSDSMADHDEMGRERIEVRSKREVTAIDQPLLRSETAGSSTRY